MKAIIVEDEKLAANELINRLKEVAPQINVVATAASVAEAVKVIGTETPDLIFMDINLGDGSSFDIFEQVEIAVPVIFITAYDEYALKAFKHQGIDYILKPFESEELVRAVAKLNLTGREQPPPIDNQKDRSKTKTSGPSDAIRADDLPNSYQERFLVSIGPRMRSIVAGEVAYFMADGKYVTLFTHEGNSYLIHQTIATLSERLDPDLFFRINRRFIVSFSAIREMIRYSNNRIKILLKPVPPDSTDAIVSADRVQGFREWLNQ